jgi:pSer/pThr/pTyr-binding forkhead associated (FHA) protein
VNNQKPKIVLKINAPDGVREILLTDGELKIGRGAVNLQIADTNLSRHHATIFRDGERVWILDNRSTNGTFVNGAETATVGSILRDGDVISLGDSTTLRLEFVKEITAKKQKTKTAVDNEDFNFVPLIVAGVAVVVIGLAILAVASGLFAIAPPSADANDEIAANPDNDDDFRSDLKSKNSKIAKPEKLSNAENKNAASEKSLQDFPINDNRAAPPPPPPLSPTKTYLEMSDAEKRAFIEKEAKIVAGFIGNTSGEAVPPEAVERIKIFVDAYAKRLKNPKLSGNCNFTRDNLETLIERASGNAHFIVPAFNAEGLAPQIGLYLAMIESEHCVCLQSPTGPLGMFQFATATAQNFGLKAVRGASPANPDERCAPEKAAPAAARYMKFLMGRYGTGSLSVPLAIASYNSGEGGLSANLNAALEGAAGQERSFWTLVANQGKLSAQFQKENIKYVPKFFAAAIVGENPVVFGLKKPPVSSNTK